MLSILWYSIILASLVYGISLFFRKKWKLATGLLLVGIAMFVCTYWVQMGQVYTFTISYPAACWTDEGKQIVYLMDKKVTHKSSWGFGGSALKSKTYLMIMDADGKNKKVVGEVLHPREKQDFEDAMKKYEEGKIFLRNFGKFESSDGQYSLRLDGSDVEITEYKNWRKIIWSMNYTQKKNYLFIPFWWKV